MELTYPQITIITGLLLILAELILGIQAGFDLVVIGSVLILGGIFGILTGNFSVTLIISSVLAVAYIFFGRKLIKQKLIFKTNKTNIDKLIGAQATVIRSITPDTAGLVRINDEDWRAILSDEISGEAKRNPSEVPLSGTKGERATSEEVLYEKDKVIVTAVEGVSLIVKKP